MKIKPKEPQTPEEWQEDVDAAIVMTAMNAARWYGLIIGGPEVNMRRPEQILPWQEARLQTETARGASGDWLVGPRVISVSHQESICAWPCRSTGGACLRSSVAPGANVATLRLRSDD